jgi:Right handed beta helix region
LYLREISINVRGYLTRFVSAAPVWMALLSSSTAGAATIAVPAGGDLQAALANARPGDIVELVAGTTYVGNFTLPKKESAFPAKDGSDFITIRSAGPDGVAAGDRLTPDTAAPLAKLRSPNSLPVIQTEPGAHHWRLLLLELQSTTAGIGNDEILALGSATPSQNSLSQVPHDIVVDRCYIHGDSVVGTKRCVALNSAATTVTGSYIADCKRIGQEAQAIAGFNGPGPFTISNNYLEGAGENIMFGGVDPPIPQLVPSDIRITGNLISKPVKWRSEKWTVKNLLELKNARRVTIDHNVIEYNWLDAQSGFAILFTVRNQDGGCPWCQVEQVVFEHNILRHAAGGISILGVDNNHPSRQTQSITVRHNVFDDIDQRWGGGGYVFLLTGGPRDVVIDHNTIVQERAQGLVLVDGPQVLGFSFTNNVGRHNAYGIIGTDHGPGNDTISAFFPGSQIVANVIADADPARYPRGNWYPRTAEFQAQFVSFGSGDYRLVTASPWRGAGSDGQDLGVVAGVQPPSPPRVPRPQRGREP